MQDRLEKHFFHILLTNYCNQNCSFCYAGRLMASKGRIKEMSVKNFLFLIKKLNRQGGFKQIKILGGEPTLHSKFGKMMNILFKYVPQASLFTNGLFNDRVSLIIKKHVPKLQLIINIMTPAYQFNTILRQKIAARIREFSPFTITALSVIVNPETDTKTILKTVEADTLKYVQSIRIGVSNPIMGEKNTYAFRNFPHIGKKVLELISGFKKIKQNLIFKMDCGFTRCMFTDGQYKILQESGIYYLWGCFQGNLIGCLDVQSDMKAITCYSLSEAKKEDLLKENIPTVEKRLFLQQYLYQEQHLMESCKDCKYRKGKEKCKGPCIGFKMNAFSYANRGRSNKISDSSAL